MRINTYDATIVNDHLYVNGIVEDGNRPIVVVVEDFYAETTIEMAQHDHTVSHMRYELCVALAGVFGEDNVDACDLFSSLYYCSAPELCVRVRSKISELPRVREIARGFKCILRETECDHVTKYFVINKWPRSGVLEIPDTGITLGTDSRERPTLWAYVQTSDIHVPENQSSSAAPLGCYFDIEVFSHDCRTFPSRLRLSDMVYMLSVVLEYNKQRDTQRKFCFVVGEPEIRDPDYEVFVCQSEQELIVRFCDAVREWNPDFLSGYNIHRFDIEYLEARLAIYGLHLPEIGRYPGSGFGEARGPRGARMRTFVAPGRIVLDIYLYVREYTPLTELSDFTLKAVTKHFLGEGEAKIDLEATEQFRIYKEYILHENPGPDTTELYKIVRYCVRDSDTLPRLFEHRKLEIWMTIMQLSNVLGSSMQTIESAGQYARLQPLLYRSFRNAGYVVHQQESQDVKYEGGLVECKLPGIHEFGAIVDFKSMYPSIAIAHNLCTSTLVHDIDTGKFLMMPEFQNDVDIYEITCEVAKDDNASDTASDSTADADEAGATAHVVDDADADAPTTNEEPGTNGTSDPGASGAGQGPAPEASVTDAMRRKAAKALETTVKYKKKNMRVMFTKASVRPGVIPKCFADLLRERAEIRALMPAVEHTNPAMYTYYDKIQNARKIAANSIYGILRFLAIQIAMAITSLGQRHIRATTNFIVSNFGAKHIYTDTDSCMFKIPGFTEADLPRYLEIQDAVNRAGIFPRPMEVDLEAYLHRAIFIAKKNYVARIQEPGKKIKTKERGVLTRRSDKARFVKRAYSDILARIFERDLTPLEFARVYFEWIKRLFTDDLTFDDFVRTEAYRGASAYVNKNAGIAALARRCEEAGLQATPGMRMKHVVTVSKDPTQNVKVSQRIATAELIAMFNLEIDLMHYFNVSLQHPVEKLYQVIYGELSEEIPRPPGCTGTLFTSTMFKSFKRMTREQILAWVQ